jgi:hypothetical protein
LFHWNAIFEGITFLALRTGSLANLWRHHQMNSGQFFFWVEPTTPFSWWGKNFFQKVGNHLL